MPVSDVFPQVRLKMRTDRRLRLGHRWAFSNELEELPEDLPDGGLVDLVDARGRFVGRGYFNRRTLISVRILSRDRKESIDRAFYRRRVRRAVALRERLFPGATAYRAVYSEADGLPGLVVDRYDRTVVLQVETRGMEAWRETILEVIEEVLEPGQIIERSESGYRALEGLEPRREVWKGGAARSVEIVEGEVRFLIDPLEGQKTGFFLDQRENRDQMTEYVDGGTVLDVFCYTGAWGLRALRAGASQVMGIDASTAALARAHENAARNGLEDRAQFVEGDAFEVLEALNAEGARFELVVVDPPAFAPRKKDWKAALKGYEALNRLALGLVAPGGILMSSSCSHHVGPDEFLRAINHAARRARRGLRLLELRGAARDHPVLPAMRETAYLKCAVLEVENRW